LELNDSAARLGDLRPAASTQVLVRAGRVGTILRETGGWNSEMIRQVLSRSTLVDFCPLHFETPRPPFEIFPFHFVPPATAQQRAGHQHLASSSNDSREPILKLMLNLPPFLRKRLVRT
jgi:hypothetical protein